MEDITVNLDKLTQAQIADLATSCLERLEPGRQPLPLFTQLARHVVTSTVEVVPLMERNDKIEVLMAKRSDDDLWWPGQWHLPGTVLLPTDAVSHAYDYETIVARLYTDEFSQSVVKRGDARVFDVQRRLIPRGSEQTVFAWSLIDLVEGVDAIEGGELFDAETIHEQLQGQVVVEGHLNTVKLALAEYRNSV